MQRLCRLGRLASLWVHPSFVREAADWINEEICNLVSLILYLLAVQL